MEWSRRRNGKPEYMMSFLCDCQVFSLRANSGNTPSTVSFMELPSTTPKTNQVASYTSTQFCFPVFFVPFFFIPTSESLATHLNRFYFSLLHILIKNIFSRVRFFLLCCIFPSLHKSTRDRG